MSSRLASAPSLWPMPGGTNLSCCQHSSEDHLLATGELVVSLARD